MSGANFFENKIIVLNAVMDTGRYNYILTDIVLETFFLLRGTKNRFFLHNLKVEFLYDRYFCFVLLVNVRK